MKKNKLKYKLGTTIKSFFNEVEIHKLSLFADSNYEMRINFDDIRFILPCDIIEYTSDIVNKTCFFKIYFDDHVGIEMLEKYDKNIRFKFYTHPDFVLDKYYFDDLIPYEIIYFRTYRFGDHSSIIKNYIVHVYSKPT